MKDEFISMKRTARLAGLLYLVLALAGAYGIMYVSTQLFVKDDALATANNIRAHEFLLRTGIVSHLLSATVFLFMVLTLYRLLKSVNEHRARVMVALVVVQVPIIFIIEALRFTALRILTNDSSAPVVLPAPDTAMLLLKIHRYGIEIVEIFWGLWLIPFGQLVYRSVFIPRLLGILLVIAGFGYVVDSCASLLLPSHRVFTRLPAFAFSAIGEISAILWLLIKGVKEDR
jgi:hypothetical protein